MSNEWADCAEFGMSVLEDFILLEGTTLEMTSLMVDNPEFVWFTCYANVRHNSSSGVC
jgi:hypothetical protein